MDATSNDIANVNTAGYKKVRTGFRDLVYTAQGNLAPNARTGSGASMVQIGRGVQQGALRLTSEPFDLAIQGEGYFQVRRPDGQLALTRDGSFRVDESGQVVSTTGSLLSPGLRVPAGVDPSSVSISSDGRVTAAGRAIGRINLVTVASPTGLASAGDNQYLPTAASGAVRAAGTATIQQGALEASNVDLGDAMVDLLDAQRSFQMGSRAVQMQDKMMEIANGLKVS
jgi:flagellar basal-body rod protein FlgG